MGTKQFDNYADLITFTRASGGTALRPISYGSELVTNGTFDADTDWTKGTGWTISGGELVATSAATASATYQNFTTVVGQTYTATIDCSAITAGSFRLYYRINGGAFQNYVNIVAGETTSLTFTASTTSSRIVVYPFFTSSGVFDNISVKEVLFDQPNAPLTLFNHPTNIPRIEYDADGNRLGLLVEEQRTNLALYSEEFDNNISWSTANSTISANTVIAPDGTLSGDKLVANTSSLAHFVACAGANTGTYSVFAKAGEFYRFRINSGSSGNGIADFNLLSGTVSYGGTYVTGGSITPVGNGWYRCSVTFDSSPTTTFTIVLQDSSGSLIFAGNGFDGIYLWGAQLEAGAFPTSYIPTSGSTATRAADSASIPTSAFGYNASEGTVVCESRTFGVGSGVAKYIFQLDDGTNNNRNLLYISSGEENRWFTSSGGATQQVTTSGATTNNVQINYAGAYKKDDFAFVVDGASPVTDTGGITPSGITVARIGNDVIQSQQLNGHIKSLKYYPRRLSDAQLQELTQ